MAIAPPSDLILDVARAADPAGLAEAAGRLRAIAAGGSGEGFALAFRDASTSASEAASATRATAASRGAAPEGPGRKFEAMVLTQFVETMLPDDTETLFGKGSAGEIWKSMLAEQVAGQIAASGGVGIADMISDTLEQGART